MLSFNLDSWFVARSWSSALVKKGASGLLTSPWSESKRQSLSVALMACY